MTLEEALKWADTFGPWQDDPPTGDAPALMTLAAEVRRLEVDARRYQWLRHRTAGRRDNEGRQYFSFPSMFGLPPVTDLMQGSVGQHLDAAIDAHGSQHDHRQPCD